MIKTDRTILKFTDVEYFNASMFVPLDLKSNLIFKIDSKLVVVWFISGIKIGSWPS